MCLSSSGTAQVAGAAHCRNIRSWEIIVARERSGRVLFSTPHDDRAPRSLASRLRTPLLNRTQALAGMRALGLQNSLTCEGILQSARSIEAAFAVAPTTPAVAGLRTATTAAGASTAAAAAAREAAVSRSRKLLNFVDHRADQLLLASGDSGRWFVDPSGATGGGGVDGDGHARRGYISSSGSESDDTDEGSEEGGEDELEEGAEEAGSAAGAERRERRREKKERDRTRADAAAAAALRPPPNGFVEELASIAWLPVYGWSPNDLLPWKVCLGAIVVVASVESVVISCVYDGCWCSFNRFCRCIFLCWHETFQIGCWPNEHTSTLS